MYTELKMLKISFINRILYRKNILAKRIMNKQKAYIAILACCLSAIVLLIINHYFMRMYPSDLDSTCVEALGIDFTAVYQPANKSLSCAFKNHNSYDVGYGEDYYIEIKKEGIWYRIKNADAWPAVGYTLSANEQHDLSISLSSFKKLQPCYYRVVKFIILPPNQKQHVSNVVIAYFQVK